MTPGSALKIWVRPSLSAAHAGLHRVLSTSFLYF
jgi:hypothetical protein